MIQFITGNNFLQDCSGKKEMEPQWNTEFKLASKLNFKGQGIAQVFICTLAEWQTTLQKLHPIFTEFFKM